MKAGPTCFIIAGTLLLTAAASGAQERSGSLSEEVAAPSSIRTGIDDIRTFLTVCPTNDPQYQRIRQDFELRLDGVVIADPITCTEPLTTLPLAGVNTGALLALQAFRIAYYMGIGTPGYLPWTSKGLYDWMADLIAGVNLKTAPGQLYCCDHIDGKLYVSRSLFQGSGTFPADCTILCGQVSFFAHEVRHADPGALGHTTGCPAFPSPAGPAGCDATYDLSNLGGYGMQYWLFSSWASGYINIGIGCSPSAIARNYAEFMAFYANEYLDRFVTNAPPAVTAAQPYGGPCQPPPNEPTGVVAAADSPTSVTISWNVVAFATTYDIYRSAAGSTYAKVGSTSASTFTDTTAPANTAFLYAVKAVDASGNASAFSASDIATTTIFTDPVLTAGSTAINAVHFNELRTVVNAVRALAGLAAYGFTDPIITPGVTVVRSSHVLELRTALDGARTALSLSPIAYTNTVIGGGMSVVSVADINDLRNGVK
jgi:hypothetical protein